MMNLRLLKLQAAYFVGGLFVLPLTPFLYLQGKYTRWKVGKLPDAEGETRGTAGEGEGELKLLVLGESTVAGIGARTHETAITGNLARFISAKTKTRVAWEALGVSGITAQRTIEELVPKIPNEQFDLIAIVLGGNDLFRLRTPFAWRRVWRNLLESIRAMQPEALILIANVPRVKHFPAFPHPLKFVLWNLAQLQHANMIDFLEATPDIVYFKSPGVFRVEDFADGIHPSELGYERWAQAMVNFLFAQMETRRGSLAFAKKQHYKSPVPTIFQTEE